MYEIIKRRLERGGYTLEDARKRLHYLVASGEIQPEQAEELMLAVEAHANRESGTAPDISDLREQVAHVENVLQALNEVMVPASKRALVQAALERLAAGRSKGGES